MSKEKERLEQVEEDVKDLLMDIQDDPNIVFKLDKILEKYKDYTTGDLAECVPGLEKCVTVMNEGLTTMSSLLIKKDERNQVLEHSNELMSQQLTVRDKEKIKNATALYAEEVQKNKQRTKSRLYRECKEEYQKLRTLTG